LNKVEIISKENKVKVFIDGIKIKGLQNVNFQRDISNPKATLEIKFKCNLYTKEQPIEEVARFEEDPSVE